MAEVIEAAEVIEGDINVAKIALCTDKYLPSRYFECKVFLNAHFKYIITYIYIFVNLQITRISTSVCCPYA